VVEDDLQTRELYRAALNAAGYGVVAVPDGLDALRIMEQDRPAAVVLDLGLPRLAGSDVAAEMAAQPALMDIPVIIVTGNAGPIDTTRFACVLHKPIDATQLIDAVEKCLAGRRDAPLL
jgi:CheY-like chemotaxis protein